MDRPPRMPDSAFARLADAVADALERPPAERAALLDAALADAPGLRAEAAALVAAHDAAEAADALRSPLDGHGADAEALPASIGPWRVTGALGEGGMGVVVAAERSGPGFVQRAAVKRVRAGSGADFRARFLRERGVLAALDHPGIARLLDAGVDDVGAPYLAMERVDGRPIPDAAAGRDVAARLALVAEACDAVAYAHRNLVVHRDLKPAHILVDDAGRVRLLDFGVAKLLDPAPAGRPGDGPAAPELTRSGAAPLTPQYAAPEQVRGGAITTATDVYALGLILFEVLTGRRPYALAGATAAEAERLVCDVPPPAPSAVAPPDAARALRGDLDTITRTALEKDPARRYASAEALAADLRRHLAGRPVEARPASWAYTAGRFVRRNRVPAAAGALALAALVVGAGVALWQARTAAAARDAAQAEADRAEAVSEFLTHTLLAASPATGAGIRPSELRVVDALRPAAEAAQAAFPDRPDVRAAVLHAVGQTFLDLGLYAEAAPALGEALRLRAALPDVPDRIATLDALGFVGMWRPDLADPAARFAESLALRRAHFGPASAEAAMGLANLAEWHVEQDRHAVAAPLLGEALRLVRAGLGTASVPGAEVYFVYGVGAFRAGRLAAADSAFADLLGLARALVAAGEVEPDDDRIATLLVWLGQTRLLGGRPAEAERLLREAAARRAARYDAGHPVRAEAEALRAVALLDAADALAAQSGAPARAEAARREAARLLAAARPGLAGGDPYTEQRHLARLAAARAGAAVPAADLRADLAAVRRELGPAHPWARHAERTLARLR